MTLLTSFIKLVVIAALLLPTGCNSLTQTSKKELSVREATSAILKVFSDFEFVGDAPFNGTVETPPHDFDRKTLPSYLETERQYVFHRNRRNDGDEMPFQSLQKRFANEGIIVFDTKLGPHRYIGGSEFIISFEAGEFKGSVFNSLDWQIIKNPALYERWDPDDFILVLKASVQDRKWSDSCKY